MAESSSSTPDSGLGTLRVLPPEIRGMIYAPLFCTGHTALARVSKGTNEDTKSSLFQHGFCHIEIQYLFESGSYSWKVVRKPSPTVLPRIKNLHVHVTLSGIGRHLNISTMRNAGSTIKDNDVISIFQATWISSADDSNSIFDQPGTAGVTNTAVLSLESRSLLSLLRQLVDQMEKPGQCVFECNVIQHTTAKIPSTIFDSMELLRNFSRVEIDFYYGPYVSREWAVEILEHYTDFHNDAIATTSENTKRMLGPRGELDQGPQLKMINRLSYRADPELTVVKFWGDEPEDKDYGLGEWTEALGRVWPPKPA